MVTREEFYVNSNDGIHMLHGYRWFDPEKTYIGVLQIVHGMMEYCGRYEELAQYMAAKGYFVIAHDHLGHGDSVNNKEELGYVGEQPDALLLKDMDMIRTIAVSYAPKAPFIMLGHSMGALLIRRYAIYFGRKLDGMILLGSVQPGLLYIKTGLAVAGFGMLQSKDKGYSRFLDYMICGKFSRIPYRFSKNGYKSLLLTMNEVVDRKRADRMPKDLPVLILSGDQDPLAGNGSQVQRFIKMLDKIGMKNVSSTMYAGKQHDILHDADRESIFFDISEWCRGIVEV